MKRAKDKTPQQRIKTRKMATIAMLCAAALILVALVRIPIVLFLKYDPKDIVIVLGGFIYGPMTSALISLIVSFIEMVTISSDGILGFIMNVIAGVSFSCPAAFIYKRKRTRAGALLGLLTGVITVSAVMLLWNYIITPIFLNQPRETVVPLLTTAILPFNLLKGSINAGLTLLLYKPIVTGLRRARLIPPSDNSQPQKSRLGIILIALIIIITSVLIILSMNSII
ncbi:MAG: ECF transporter S component [Fastidiosipilaceae bacterium]|jgi:riboflavin transporter FmnP|nr:ECF transporter S component [Clostridiaceae bacterium]